MGCTWRVLRGDHGGGGDKKGDAPLEKKPLLSKTALSTNRLCLSGGSDKGSLKIHEGMYFFFPSHFRFFKP